MQGTACHCQCCMVPTIVTFPTASHHLAHILQGAGAFSAAARLAVLRLQSTQLCLALHDSLFFIMPQQLPGSASAWHAPCILQLYQHTMFSST
jgi:hypothetical protein